MKKFNVVYGGVTTENEWFNIQVYQGMPVTLAQELALMWIGSVKNLYARGFIRKLGTFYSGRHVGFDPADGYIFDFHMKAHGRVHLFAIAHPSDTAMETRLYTEVVHDPEAGRVGYVIYPYFDTTTQFEPYKVHPETPL